MNYVRFLMTLWNKSFSQTLRKLADLIEEQYPEGILKADDDTVSEYTLQSVLKKIYKDTVR